MKFPAILAAAWLALAPAIVPAASETPAGTGKPTPGPTAGRALDNSAVPVLPIVVGGVVILGALLVGALGSTSSNNNTNGASVAPTNQ